MLATAYTVRQRTQKEARSTGEGTSYALFCVPGRTDNAGRGTTGWGWRQLRPFLRTRPSRLRRKRHDQSAKGPVTTVSAYTVRQRTQKRSYQVGGTPLVPVRTSVVRAFLGVTSVTSTIREDRTAIAVRIMPTLIRKLIIIAREVRKNEPRSAKQHHTHQKGKRGIPLVAKMRVQKARR